MFDRVLIANRGEIAVRVTRTLHALGAEAIAIYSDADAEAAHVDAADVAVRIGPAEARLSYLDARVVLAAAVDSGAQAVHPGYGFLSENAVFAQTVVDAGMTWIGPPPAAIELMGDKARAKVLARDAGVPVVPGIEGADLTLEQIDAFIDQHGVPVVIKAVAGGGGKGMRVVDDAARAGQALDAARREAKAAFGDDRVLVERYLQRPRHIEIQVLADTHGNVVHLGERECSLQRRHQKVVEEAPSPAVSAQVREAMGAAAVALARACGYVGVGTVEFIVAGDDPSAFFFLEMNTRLQVEHPVTELVYGVDLVEQQLLVAAGAALTLTQDQLVPVGHAIEARLYAENPAAGFLPSTGLIRCWREPAGEGVRVDTGVAAGTEVQTHYDPMLAKLIAHGPDRATAIARLDRALARLDILGVETNAAFTRALLARADVRAGQLDTGLLERVLAELAVDVPEDLLPAAALIGALIDAEALAAHTSVPAGWRSSGGEGTWRRRVAPGDGDTVEVSVSGSSVSIGDVSWTGSARRLDADAVRVTLGGVSRRYIVAAEGEDLWIGRDGHALAVPAARVDRSGATAVHGALVAPMPGTILLVNVADGDTVGEGDVLLVMESMKMELQISAPYAGVVEGLSLSVGDKVALKQPLVTVVEA